MEFGIIVGLTPQQPVQRPPPPGYTLVESESGWQVQRPDASILPETYDTQAAAIVAAWQDYES
jgi:hypothetical protein